MYFSRLSSDAVCGMSPIISYLKLEPLHPTTSSLPHTPYESLPLDSPLTLSMSPTSVSSHSTHHLILTLPYLTFLLRTALHCTTLTHTPNSKTRRNLPHNHLTNPPTNAPHTPPPSPPAPTKRTQHLPAITTAHPTLHYLTSSPTARSAHTHYTFTLKAPAQVKTFVVEQR